MTCAEREKTDKMKIKVAVSGFIRWNFNNKVCKIYENFLTLGHTLSENQTLIKKIRV